MPLIERIFETWGIISAVVFASLVLFLAIWPFFTAHRRAERSLFKKFLSYVTNVELEVEDKISRRVP